MLGEFGAPWVKVRVAKLGALPGVKEIGVAIERQRPRHRRASVSRSPPLRVRAQLVRRRGPKAWTR